MKHLPITLAAIAAFTLSAFTPALAADEHKTDADNTARNKHDHSGDSKTATDQSNEPADIKLVASIRQMVVKDDSLSTTAKNCKIITAGGMVTLRGPVKTNAERTTVENHAAMVAGKDKVDNQLEVKAAE